MDVVRLYWRKTLTLWINSKFNEMIEPNHTNKF